MMKGYVRCTVSPGLFDREFYVMLANGDALYVDQDDVRVSAPEGEGWQVEGQVAARVVEEVNGSALVQLPGEPVIGGSRSWVPKESVVVNP